MKKLVALFMVLVVASTAVVFSGCTKSTEDLMENAKVNLPKDKYNTRFGLAHSAIQITMVSVIFKVLSVSWITLMTVMTVQILTLVIQVFG